jgi:histone deacetylase 6
VSPDGYARMTRRLLDLAGGRVVLALEGGYNLDAIGRSAAACVRVLQGNNPDELVVEDPSSVHPLARRAIQEARRLQAPHWKTL